MTADTLDLTGTTLHLRLQAGDDVRVRFTFTSSIVGWGDWFAQIRSKAGDTWDFTIDDTDQGTGIIVLTLTAAQTGDPDTGLFGNAQLRWQFQATTDAGDIRTLFSGAVTVEKDEAVP